jgi:hypothetical protein
VKNSNTEGRKGIWKRIGKWIGRTLFLLVETVLLLAVVLYGAMFVLAKGPSPALRDIFVQSVRETSAIGFLADLYLTEEENAMLAAVTHHFPDAVLVLNIGSIMDLSFLKEYSFGAVLIAWQGGMESGNAVADLLCGKATPS